MVPAEDFKYHVVAGERRLAALKLLAEKGRIASRYPVVCRVIKAKAAAAAVRSPNLALRAATSGRLQSAGGLSIY